MRTGNAGTVRRGFVAGRGMPAPCAMKRHGAVSECRHRAPHGGAVTAQWFRSGSGSGSKITGLSRAL
jgi:hypothetical protein